MSRLPSASQIAHATKPPTASVAQPPSSHDAGKVHVSISKDSSSASNVGSSKSGTSKPGIEVTNNITGRPRIRSESQSTQPSAGVSGHQRSNSHQVTKNFMPDSNPLQSKDASFKHLPAKGQRSPLSNLQQDHAPMKSTKATMASVFTQPTTMGDRPEMSPDQIVRLQMELMQLCILHRSAIGTQRQWEESAERSLQHRFQVLRKEHSRMKHLFQERKELNNQSALVSWYKTMTSTDLAAKVQLLSQNILQIWHLTGPEGNYTRIVREFELWFGRVCSVHLSRKQVTQFLGQEIDFIETMEDSWAVDVKTTERKMASFLRELTSIGELPEESDLGQLLCSFKKLVCNILEEMDIIQAIHKDVMAQEKSWIQARVDDLTQERREDMKRIGFTPYRGIWEVITN